MFLKKLSLVLIMILSFSSLNAQAFTKQASKQAVLTQTGKQKQWCPVCGMNIKMFYKTSHSSKLADSKNRQYCSIRCLSVDIHEHKIDANSIKVVDASTQKHIAAKDAFYVLGSKVKGTMSKVSKLAFATEKGAKEFQKTYSGKIVHFDVALASAKNSLKSDTAMIMKKKTKKMYPMGKKIFQKMCHQNIEPKDYTEINMLKSAIKNKNLCKPLKERQLQAVSLYLWEVKRFGDLKNSNAIIKVTKDEKCPICGMFVYKYPKWAAQIFYPNKHYSFDGVKDLMKYYFEHKDNIQKILVTDYYSQMAIDAKLAYYVLGSDIYGPMGNELIPFKNESDAKSFYKDHKAKEIIHFKNISREDVSKLDK